METFAINTFYLKNGKPRRNFKLANWSREWNQGFLLIAQRLIFYTFHYTVWYGKALRDFDYVYGFKRQPQLMFKLHFEMISKWTQIVYLGEWKISLIEKKPVRGLEYYYLRDLFDTFWWMLFFSVQSSYESIFFFPKTNHPDLYHQGRTQNAGQSQTELGVFRITNALKMTYNY